MVVTTLTSINAATEPWRFSAQDVRRGLALKPKQLQSKYLYDPLGSQLFEAICRLPWYGVTRAENRLIQRHVQEIISAVGDPTTIIELGSGSGEKLSILVSALKHLGRRARVHLVDISSTALALSQRALRCFPDVVVTGHRSTYEEGLRKLGDRKALDEAIIVLFLGSNIGNCDPATAHDLLCQIRKSLPGGGLLLLGADLIKREAEILLAYDDPLHVTAAFNKNLLVRLNRELQAEFDLHQFEHRAVWNASVSRVESHLVSRCKQKIAILGADCVVHFVEGESIWTESSYKYEPESVVAMGVKAGFCCRNQWIDEQDRGFVLTLFKVGQDLSHQPAKGKPKPSCL